MEDSMESSTEVTPPSSQRRKRQKYIPLVGALDHIKNKISYAPQYLPANYGREDVDPRTYGCEPEPGSKWAKATNPPVDEAKDVKETKTANADEAMRSTAANMNTYGSQPRPSRLQNTQKSAAGGLGNGAGWGAGGFGSGFGGLGTAPGLGRGNLTGFAQVMGGGGGQGPIDMSDFPTLSGGPQQANPSVAGSRNNIIRQQQQQSQPQRTQQQQSQSQQQRAPSAAPSQQSANDQFDRQPGQGDREGGGEEFPSLSGQVNGDAFGQQSNGYGSLRSPEEGGIMHSQLPFRDPGASYQQQPAIGSGGSSQAQSSGQQQQTSTAQQPTQNGQSQGMPVKKWSQMNDAEKWGMPGFMAAFEARRHIESGGQVDESLPAGMKSAVFMGQDLSALGLDLENSEPILPTFAAFPSSGPGGANGSSGTYDFTERHVVPEFQLPNAYTVTNVPPLSARIGAFSDETLFQVFYQHPRDMLQEQAAAELTNRDWRWHKVLRQWLMKDPPSHNTHSSSSIPMIDMTNGAPAGAASVRLGGGAVATLGAGGGERGVFIFFDAQNWRRERREFLLSYDELDTRYVATLTPSAGGSGPAPPLGMPIGPPVSAGGGGVGGGGAGSAVTGMGSSGVVASAS